MTASTTFVATDGNGYELTMGRWSKRLAGPFLDFVDADAFIGKAQSNGRADDRPTVAHPREGRTPHAAAGGRPATVLDVGCGTGHLAHAIATRAPAVQVQAIDLAPAYVAYAKARYPDAAITFGLGDACALNYPDRTFDLVLSMLVLHFVPRTHDALAEMRRVAKPGALVGAAVWDVRGGFVANRMFFDTAAALDPRAAEKRARNYTRPMTRPGELGAAWRAAGFVDVRETSLQIRMEFESFDDYWAPYLGNEGPAAEYVRMLDGDERARLHDALRLAYLDGEPDGARSYAALAWAVKGHAP